MRKRKLDPSVIRVGDRITIVDPKMFIRVGYPLSFDEAVSKTEVDFKKEIDGFINSILANHNGALNTIGLKYALVDESGYYSTVNRLRRDITRDLAFWAQQDKYHFGGDERSIHTVDIPAPPGYFDDKMLYVYSVRYVQTGVRRLGRYTEEGDEPNYLANQKRHKILQVGMAELGDKWLKNVPWDWYTILGNILNTPSKLLLTIKPYIGDSFLIEECRVKKVIQ